MKNSREIPEVKEVSQEEIRALSNNLFELYAVLETASIALYNLQSEPEAIRKAVTISFAVEKAAKDCEALKAVVDDMAERTR